jgi:hypothetical protein
MGQDTDTLINVTLIENLGDAFNIRRRPIFREHERDQFYNKCYYIYDHKKNLLGTLRVYGTKLVLRRNVTINHELRCLEVYGNSKPFEIDLCDGDCFKKIREYYTEA